MTADSDIAYMKHLEWFRWFAVATGILLFVAAIAFSHSAGVSQAALDRVVQYDWSTSAFQGRNEAAEMERRVTRLALRDDQPSLAKAVQWHQIMLSRIRSWGNSDFGQFIEDDPRLIAMYGTLVADMDSLGTMLLHMSDERAAGEALDQAGTVTRAIEKAGAIKLAVDRLGMRALAYSLTEMTQARDNFRTKQTAQRVFNSLLFATGLILLLVTIWQNRSLVRGNAAIASGARKLAESEARLSEVLENTTDCVVVLDTYWRVAFANQTACRMIAEFPLGARIWDVLPQWVGTDVQKNCARAMEQHTPVDFEFLFQNVWFEIHAFPGLDNLSIFFREVTERHRVKDELVYLARHDPLTGLANRALFNERLAAGLQSGRRDSDLILVAMDLDGFKEVNDAMGHAAGDVLLKEFASRLTGLVRKGDTVARPGGDEFSIIQPGPVEPDRGKGIARRISDALLTPFVIGGQQITIGTSIGIAIAPEHGTEPEVLVRNADLALYRAKKTKGTSLNYCVFTPAMAHHFGPHQTPQLEPLEISVPSVRTEKSPADDLGLYNARLTTALNCMSQGLCMFDADQKLIICNEEFARMYGIPPEQLQPGTPFRLILQSRIDSGQPNAGDPEDYLRERIEAAEEQIASVNHYHLTDGRSIAITHFPLAGGGWLATHDDITDTVRFEAKIANMAHHDALTGLHNRNRFREKLGHALTCGEHLALLCLNLDQFKTVNDALGHPIGDALLRQVADRLRKEAPGCDLSRLGGDTFAVLQGDVLYPENAKALSERIIAAVSQPYDVDGHQVIVGASIGIAGAPTDSSNADEFLRRANMALYQCKLEGRGGFRFFDPGMDAKIQARRGLELDLRKAIAKDQLEIYYQPIVNIKVNRITGFEALLRWSHAGRGNVSPREFVPLAEEIGLIGELGAWVLMRACSEAAKWPTDVGLSVNLSPAQFIQRDLIVDVAAALEHSGLPANRLELEITETTILQDTSPTLAILHRLRDLGVHISLDDFGTGFSSLSVVRKFPFDRLKIDQSFIADMDDQAGALGIVRAVLALGDSQGMAITAEGVETMEQLTRLRAEGCLEVQGYFFSPARPASEIAGLLTSMSNMSSHGQG